MLTATDLMGEWLAVLGESTLRGSLIIAIGAATAWVVRRQAAALRSTLWLAVAGAILVLPVLSETLPRWRVGAPRLGDVAPAAARVGRPDPSSATARQTGERFAAPGREGGGVAEPRVRVSLAQEWRSSDAIVVGLFAIWVFGASFVVGQVVISAFRVRRIERLARGVDPDVVRARLGALSENGVDLTRVRVLEGSAHLAPMTWGIVRPRVLVPAGWERWPAHVTATVLAHELAHVRRRDIARQVPWDLARALFWFNPLIPYAARQARLACEQACDDAVVARGLSPTRYADALLALARMLRGARALGVPALAGGGRTEFTRRIAALADPARKRRASRVSVVAVGSLLTGVTAASASLSFEAAPGRETVVRGDVGRALDSALVLLEARGLSGTVLVDVGGDVVLAKGYGFAHRSRRIPALADTRYHAAGIAKAFTAAAVADLIDRGLVSASDPVGRYLPELHGAAGGVTVHQLLTHTDGFGDPGDIPPGASSLPLLITLGGLTPAFPAGTSYNSADVGHSVLAALVERVTGRPFEAYVRGRFLEPAGMTSSYFRAERRAKIGDVAVGYTGGEGAAVAGAVADAWGVRGSRGLVTTVYDLRQWHAALTGGRLVRQGALDLMFTPYLRTAKPFEQGYGWLLYDDRTSPPFRGGPVPVRRRSGREPGFEAELVHDPNGGWLAVVLLNTDDGRRLTVLQALRAVINANAPPGSATR